MKISSFVADDKISGKKNTFSVKKFATERNVFALSSCCARWHWNLRNYGRTQYVAEAESFRFKFDLWMTAGRTRNWIKDFRLSLSRVFFFSNEKLLKALDKTFNSGKVRQGRGIGNCTRFMPLDRTLEFSLLVKSELRASWLRSLHAERANETWNESSSSKSLNSQA